MATIRDVARLSGVSTATVSHVLNLRTDRVGAETRERVLAAVRTLKYRPTALESNQKAILTRNLAFVTEDLTFNPISKNSYYRTILDVTLEVAAFRGWSLTLSAEKMWGDSGHVVRRNYDGRCDGVLFVAPTEYSNLVNTLQERGIPLCLIGTTPWHSEVSATDVDNVEVGRKAARHLIELGHRKLAYVPSSMKVTSSRERLQGFSQLAAENNISVIHVQGGIPEALELVGLGRDRPTGFFTWHDGNGYELVDAFTAFGLKVPDDVSVVGVDASYGYEPHDRVLTSFVNPIADQARIAANEFLDRLEKNDGESEPFRVLLPTQFYPGDTTGPAPGLRKLLRSPGASTSARAKAPN